MSSDSSYTRRVVCFYGLIANVLTSNTDKNPSRRYYRCPNEDNEDLEKTIHAMCKLQNKNEELEKAIHAMCKRKKIERKLILLVLVFCVAMYWNGVGNGNDVGFVLWQTEVLKTTNRVLGWTLCTRTTNRVLGSTPGIRTTNRVLGSAPGTRTTNRLSGYCPVLEVKLCGHCLVLEGQLVHSQTH
ncbi:GRF zinc finger family protein [Striga asiatica]|uniref:GRF zinc finger family protein n=1 Tax=Striga asiatica TaxID=4170 RepID=A0A5A7Q6R9_STRAF|nr:GRF zinc finger family protein [Striga asiatica]